MNEKKQKRIASPEDLNDFIRVSSPALWLVLALMILSLLGSLVWGVFATVEATEESGLVRQVHPITFVID